MDKKTKILQTSMDLFKRTGSITTREVATKAGVNVASINYYFGSKEHLLREIMLQLEDHLHKVMDRILGDSQDLDSLKSNSSKEFYNFISEAPGFFIYALSFILSPNNAKALNDRLDTRYLSPVMRYVTSVVTDYSSVNDPAEIRNRSFIFMSSLAVSFITSGSLEVYKDMDDLPFMEYGERNNFESYISSLIELIVK